MRSASLLFASLALAGCGGVHSGDDAGIPDGSQDAGARSIVGTHVVTQEGAVDGEADDDLVVFRGIPYAEPPVGPLRFAPPVPHARWDGALDATAFGPMCPQQDSAGAIVGEEDCLTLDVWAHADAETHPVMVFIHGGGFVQGSGTEALYDGAGLARAGDVVLVTLNYRLGALGFLATEALASESDEDSAGNYGIRDQIAALEWVQRNIAAFGGDPAQVTIFGESAGGVSVCAHIGSPLSRGLFARAIIESGGGCYGTPQLRTSTPLQASAMDIGAMVRAAVGCDGASDEAACLRAVDAADVVRAQGAITANALGIPELGPNIDGVVLTGDTRDLLMNGDVPDVPVITGTNADEATIFTLSTAVPTEAAYETLVRAFAGPLADDVLALYPASDFLSPKDAYNHLFSDVGFICPALSFAAAASGGSAPSYTYHFTRSASGAAALLGAFHGLELGFVFGNVPAGYTPTSAELALRDAMQAAWTSFARGEEPRTSPAWPAYDAADPAILVFDDPVSVTAEIREGRCAALHELGIVP